MPAVSLSLSLLWLGALVLLAVVVNRWRRGAWDALAWTDSPPVPRSLWVAAAVALALTVAGAVLAVREVL